MRICCKFNWKWTEVWFTIH